MNEDYVIFNFLIIYLYCLFLSVNVCLMFVNNVVNFEVGKCWNGEIKEYCWSDDLVISVWVLSVDKWYKYVEGLYCC